MATLREAIARLDAVYDPLKSDVDLALAEAETARTIIYEEYQAKYQAIIDYYKAVAELPIIQDIVDNPPPETVD